MKFLEETTIYAQTKQFPEKEFRTADMGMGLVSGNITQSEIRGRANQVIDHYLNFHLYVDKEPDMGYISAFRLSEMQEYMEVILQEAENRGYERPDFDAVICGIVGDIPINLPREMEALGLTTYSPKA